MKQELGASFLTGSVPVSWHSWKLLRVILVALSPSIIMSLVTVVSFKCPDSLCSLWRPFVQGPNLSRLKSIAIHRCIVKTQNFKRHLTHDH